MNAITCYLPEALWSMPSWCRMATAQDKQDMCIHDWRGGKTRDPWFHCVKCGKMQRADVLPIMGVYAVQQANAR